MPAMARRSPVSLIDQLYQVPLSQFTAERNALARGAGPDAAGIRALQKPTLAAWAINQLYWRKRDVYDELLECAGDLRATHNAALRGKRADLRGAGRSHEEAIERALQSTLALLADSGHPVTDATRQAVVSTLRALPSDDAPGRLTRQLQPRGFEALGGLASQGRVRTARATAPRVGATPAPGSAPPPTRQAARLASARAALAASVRATREAEQAARRHEFEVARAARDAEKAERSVTAAEESLRQAQVALDDARRAAATIRRARETVEARAGKAADQLATARAREELARRQLDELE
jgi:hypothetical protein